MPVSTEEAALIILAAVAAEQNRQPTDVRGRRPLGMLTKDIIRQRGWQEMDFLQGWGLIMSEKLAEVQQVGDGYYPNLTTAGREFMEAQHAALYRKANQQSLLTGTQVMFIIRLAVIAILLWYMLWKANH